MGDPVPMPPSHPGHDAPLVHRSLPIPTTFGGVAALASGPGRWLSCWQILMALASAAVVAWAVDATLGRDLSRAAERLPASGEIRGGRLDWGQRPRRILFQGPFLGVVVDPTAARDAGLTSDFTLSIEPDRFAVRSLFGWWQVAYPPDLRLKLGRLDVTGALAAWMQPVLLAVGVGVFFGLLGTWTVLSFLYGTLLWAFAVTTGRTPGLSVAWRLAGASLLLPGALMTAAIALYATRELSLVGLMAALPIHVVAGWIFCIGGTAHLPRPAANPFQPPQSMEPAEPVPSAAPQNPFERP
jgi:hypothetical protein